MKGKWVFVPDESEYHWFMRKHKWGQWTAPSYCEYAIVAFLGVVGFIIRMLIDWL